MNVDPVVPSGLAAAHIVQFYETDDHLAGVVAEFIAEGLAAGEAVVILATEAHQGAFIARASARGAEVESALASGRLLVLDAEATLARFMVGAMPDEGRFRGTLDAALEAATGGDRALGVRAYGEMVDVLWRAGNPEGALRLEELWNDAQRERSFSLLCAYVMASFYREATGLSRVCATHGHVRRPEPAANTAAVVAHAFAAEIAQRTEVENTLRACLRDLRAKEDALRSSEAQLRDLVENGGVGLHWVGPDGTILWANRAELELLGYDASEYVGRPITDFHVDADAIAQTLRRLHADEAVKDLEARMRTRDGSIKHVLIDSSVYREGDRFVHTRCFTRDITARRVAEDGLRESERRLRTITDTLPVCVAHVDSDRRYRFANKTYEAWFGQPRDTIVGEHLRDVLGVDAYADIEREVDAALRGEVVRFQRLVRYRNGERFVDATYLPHRDDTGVVLGFVGLIADVTEAKRVEQARELAHERAQRLLRVTAAIAKAVTAEEVYTAVVDQIRDALGASSTGLFLVSDDGATVRLVRSVGFSELSTQVLARVPFDTTPSFPALDCIRAGAPIWIESQPDLLARYPHLAGIVTAGRSYRIACLPVVIDGNAVGAIGLTFEGALAIDESHRNFLHLVAQYSGQALERVRLLAAEQRSRERVEAAAARTQLLADASRSFAEAGAEIETVLDRLAEKITVGLADVCGVMLVPTTGDVLQVATARHRDPAATAEVRRLGAEHPQRIGEGLLGRVAQTGEALYLPQVEPETTLAMAQSPQRGWLERHVPHSIIGVPLRSRGAVIGVLTACRVATSPAFSEDDFHLVEALAERAALAVDNARLHQEDQRARMRAELLFGLARDVIQAERIEQVFDAALAAIQRGLGAPRASILTFGKDPVMQFRAWRGLSERYRTAVAGHSPWSRDTRNPSPIVVADVERDAALAAYVPLFREEGIGALAFIPLVAGGQLLGKFMVYYDRPRAVDPTELDLAGAIADHVAAALARFAAVVDLQETVRFNELFTGILGHDLRNPLGAIMTSAQLALVRSEGEKIGKPLSRIVSSSERMSRMIDQLLDFTRVRVGEGIPLTPQSMDLLPVVRQVIGELEDANPDWSLVLDVQGATIGEWDADRLGQVFSNLVGNAIQHGEVAAGVSIRIDGTQPDEIRAEVRNRGVIPPEVLPTIFEPLAGGRRLRGGSRGLGLGLHITREIVNAHGGAIALTSGDASGTSFALTLPRSSRKS